MPDFKVGDRVLLNATGSIFEVEEVGDYKGDIFAFPIVRVGGLWRHHSYLTLVPPEKPKYRLGRDVGDDYYTDSVYAAFDDTGRAVVAYFGPDEANKEAAQAEAMVRAAMAALGYEEAHS